MHTDIGCRVNRLSGRTALENNWLELLTYRAAALEACIVI